MCLLKNGNKKLIFINISDKNMKKSLIEDERMKVVI